MFQFLIDPPLAALVGYPSDYKTRFRAAEIRARVFRTNLQFFTRMVHIVNTEHKTKQKDSETQNACAWLKKEYAEIFGRFREDELYYDTLPLMDWVESMAKAWDASMMEIYATAGMPRELADIRGEMEKLWDDFLRLEKSDTVAACNTLLDDFTLRIRNIITPPVQQFSKKFE